MTRRRPLVTALGAGVHLVTGTNVNWAVVSEGASVTLVDTGYPNDAGLLVDSLAMLGHRPEAVEAVLLTHAHLDHLGGVPVLRRLRPGPVLTGHEEARHARREYLEQISLREMAGLTVDAAGRRWVARTLRAVLPHAAVRLTDVTGVDDGRRLDLPGGPVPVVVGGHTPGHTCWLLPDRGALFSGDALVTHHPVARTGVGPQLLPSVFNADDAATASALTAMRDLPADLLIPGHGPAHRGALATAVDAALADRRSG